VPLLRSINDQENFADTTVLRAFANVDRRLGVASIVAALPVVDTNSGATDPGQLALRQTASLALPSTNNLAIPAAPVPVFGAHVIGPLTTARQVSILYVEG
jgi:hypothetical protein